VVDVIAGNGSKNQDLVSIASSAALNVRDGPAGARVAKIPNISISYLHECLELSSDGRLFWRRRPLEHFADRRAHAIWNSRFPGMEAGSLTWRGFAVVGIAGQNIHADRVIAAMMTGASCRLFRPCRVDLSSRKRP
jgi:hypothetical protein